MVLDKGTFLEFPLNSDASSDGVRKRVGTEMDNGRFIPSVATVRFLKTGYTQDPPESGERKGPGGRSRGEGVSTRDE